MYRRLSAAPALSYRRGAPLQRNNIMSDMHTARRAGGGNISFTVVVVLLILLVVGGLVWRATHDESDLPQQSHIERN
jgi:hypothetical protein